MTKHHPYCVIGAYPIPGDRPAQECRDCEIMREGFGEYPLPHRPQTAPKRFVRPVLCEGCGKPGEVRSGTPPKGWRFDGWSKTRSNRRAVLCQECAQAKDTA
jgi:hypothetical protein